jgi:hypothetical protein
MLAVAVGHVGHVLRTPSMASVAVVVPSRGLSLFSASYSVSVPPLPDYLPMERSRPKALIIGW